MVINSALMQNAGKEFMFSQGLSMKNDKSSSADSFSAIFNNVTGRGNLFELNKPQAKLQAADSGNKQIFADKKFDKNFENKSVKSENPSRKDVFSERADLTDEAKTAEVTETDEDESFFEKAASFLFQITVTVTVVLSVSMDELKEGMQELGMEPMDLLQADNRYKLFVNLKADGDAINLLKDNSLVDLLNTLENSVADLFTTEGINPSNFEETFKLTVDTVVEKTNEIMKQFMNAVSGNATIPKADNEADIEENGKDIQIIDGIQNDKLPKVEVSTESQNGSTEKNNTESSKKDKTQQIKADDLSQKFVNHLVNSFEARFSSVKVTEIQAMPDIREIVNQILEQVKIHVNNANTSIEIQLTPESLGKVQVSVENNNGIMTAKFQAESRVAKEAIESNLIQFKEHLAEQGIKVDSVEVSVGNFDFTGNQFGKGQHQDTESHVKKHFSLEDVSSIGAEGKEDLKEAAYIDNGTSTVSFTA